MSHAYLAPSAAAYWGAPGGCRAYPMLNALILEKPESPEAREGTAAHELAAVAIQRALRALPFPSDMVGTQASNGVVLTEEMAEAVQVYSDDVRAEAIQRGVFTGNVEQRVMLPRIHPLNGGTPDFWLHDPRNRVIVLYDFKFGHDDVEAFENWQLINYAALIIDKLGIDDQHYTVLMKVVQPRSYKKTGPVDTWRVAASDLRPYWNDLAHGAAEATSNNPPARPSRRCKNCDARHTCEGLRMAAGAAMDYTRTATGEKLPDVALALELKWLQNAADLVAARLSGLESEALHRMEAGTVLPGYELAPAYGRPQFKDDAEAIRIGAAFGIDIRQNKPVTPSQAKKAGLPADIVDQFSFRPSGGKKLKPVHSTKARKVFTQ